jgi:hypothetical protein
VDLLAGWQRACPLHAAKTVSGAWHGNNTVSRCGRHTFHHPATGIVFVGKAWWQLIVIVLTFAAVLIGVIRAAQPIGHSSLSSTKHSRADRFEAAINEIEALVGDKYPISRAVQDVIKRKSPCLIRQIRLFLPGR